MRSFNNAADAILYRTPEIVMCASEGDVEGVRACLLAGDDVNTEDESYGTALHMAAAISSPSLVDLLLSTGNADTSIEDYKGRKPIDRVLENLAAAEGMGVETGLQKQVISLLKAHEASGPVKANVQSSSRTKSERGPKLG